MREYISVVVSHPASGHLLLQPRTDTPVHTLGFVEIYSSPFRLSSGAVLSVEAPLGGPGRVRPSLPSPRGCHPLPGVSPVALVSLPGDTQPSLACSSARHRNPSGTSHPSPLSLAHMGLEVRVKTDLDLLPKTAPRASPRPCFVIRPRQPRLTFSRSGRQKRASLVSLHCVETTHGSCAAAFLGERPELIDSQHL